MSKEELDLGMMQSIKIHIGNYEIKSKVLRLIKGAEEYAQVENGIVIMKENTNFENKKVNLGRINLL